jgi:adenosylcobinamide-phosphate synthase
MLPSALILSVGLLGDAALGEMGLLFRLIPHPVVMAGGAISWLDRRLNRPERDPRDLRRRGIAVTVLLLGLAAAAGFYLHVVALLVPYGWLIEVFCIAVLVAQKSLFTHVHDVAKALKSGGVAEGRPMVARIVGRDVTTLDQHGVARAAIESLAENFADGVVSPVFWYVLAGLPGLFAYKMLNTLDSMIGYRNAKYLYFGWASARLDDLANLIPARLSGLIMALAVTFTPGGNPIKALQVMRTDASHHPSPNSGWPEAAMAGGLDLALGGPRTYQGGIVEGEWIGSGRAMAHAGDIDRALITFIAACLINAGLAIEILRFFG